jgi:6-pyruvoyltetrahydropterin/6-carboxytetrahydropterin synthase
MQIIERKGSFDSAHRVMNEARKCFHVHGHTYLYELGFSFEESESIGYALDFKEIKRVNMQWIDDILDHGAILNPKDIEFIDLVKNKLKTKLWLMSLNGEGEYCNPSVENIAKEVFLAMEVLLENYPLLKVYSIKINETPNCATICYNSSIKEEERNNWTKFRRNEILSYAKEKGIIEYDDRIQIK